MEISTIVTLIGGLIIIAAIIAAVYIRFKTNPNAIDKNLADEFLNGLRDVFYYKMLDIVEGFNIEDYNSLEEMEVSILRDIYETLYSYTEEKMKEAAKEDIIRQEIDKDIANIERLAAAFEQSRENILSSSDSQNFKIEC